LVGYNFGQVQRTSQVERKTKCSKKTTLGDIAVLWAALFFNIVAGIAQFKQIQLIYKKFFRIPSLLYKAYWSLIIYNLHGYMFKLCLSHISVVLYILYTYSLYFTETRLTVLAVYLAPPPPTHHLFQPLNPG